jgi:hypothetical protein
LCDGSAPLSAWPSRSTLTWALPACFSDLICSSMRSLTRRASASFASRTARCSEVSFAGGSSARDSGSVESSERVKLTIDGESRMAVESECRMDCVVAQRVGGRSPSPYLWAFYVQARSTIGRLRAPVARRTSIEEPRQKATSPAKESVHPSLGFGFLSVLSDGKFAQRSIA